MKDDGADNLPLGFDDDDDDDDDKGRRNPLIGKCPSMTRWMTPSPDSDMVIRVNSTSFTPIRNI